MFKQLCSMGFGHDVSIKAAKKHPNSMDQAITFILSQQQQTASKTNPSSDKASLVSLPQSSTAISSSSSISTSPAAVRARIERVLELCARLDGEEIGNNKLNFRRARPKLVCQIKGCPFDDADDTLPTNAIAVKSLTQKDKDHIRQFHISC